jgi:hypothetical protein
MTRVRLPEKKHVKIYSQYKDTTTFDPIENQNEIVWEKHWVQVIRQLQDTYGNEVRIGIFPDGTIPCHKNKLLFL